jgi:predicted nucleotidyltransferase
MGTESKLQGHTEGLGAALFGKTQRRVLGLLFGNPHRSFYAKEIIRHAGAGSGSVQRVLSKLAKAGLVSVSKQGNQKHYQARQDSPIFDELRGIVQKTFGLTDILKQMLSPIAERINIAFVYGSVAKGTDKASSDIDILVVSDSVTFSDFLSLVPDAENTLGRAVHPAIYKTEEFMRKRAEENAFIRKVLAGPKLFLIGSDDELQESRQFS